METSSFTDLVDESFKTGSANGDTARSSSDRDLREIVKIGDRKKLKKFLRNGSWGTGDPVRSELWLKICELSLKMENADHNSYGDTVKEIFGEDLHFQANLPNFVDPTNMHHYHLSDSGTQITKKILCVVGRQHPDIAYGPTIFANTAMFLHYLKEEDTYRCMDALLNSRNKLVIQSKIAFEASKGVLIGLAKQYAKGFVQLTKKGGHDLDKICNNWIWWIFHDLPFSYQVRIMDCYLYEGIKVLYRVALAILIHFHKDRARESNTENDLGLSISLYCEAMKNVTVEKLLKTAFSLRGLSRKKLAKLVLRSEMYVQSKINMTSTTSANKMPRSPSCESLDAKVAVTRTFSLQETGTNLLTAENWDAIWGWLPIRMTITTPELIFSTSKDGTSLRTFFNKVEGRGDIEPTLMVIKTTDGDIFGAYCSTDWEVRRRQKKDFGYFGTGETFVFNITPVPAKHGWVGNIMGDNTPNSAHFFMSASPQRLQIGGGGGIAISLDENLFTGRTERCDTFNNPPLVDKKDFQCNTLEVFGFYS